MLIIFDCDGVLVDSEILAAEVFSSCLQKFNIDLGPEQCYAHFRGHTLDFCKAWLSEKYPEIPDNFLQFLETETERVFTSSLRAVEGVEKVLLYLQERRVAFCVASNGGHKKIEHSLGVTGLLPYFSNARFSREDVSKGKPAPDLFLFAAEAMGVPPKFTVVVEDSIAGMQGALAAGMRVLAYQEEGQYAKSENRLPDDIILFCAMCDLPALLESRFT